MPKHDTIRMGGSTHIVMECGTCGVFHTIPETKYDSCLREGGFWTCPNGHSRGWKEGEEKTEINQLRRERDRLKQDAARLEDERREAVERMENAQRAVKKMKKRAAAGTCPCCQRTFSNMATHMKRQHPEFVVDTGANVVPIKAANR